jgi:hypothetical protein
MSDILWVVDYYVTYVVRVNIPVANRSSVICRRHNSSVLRSLVSNCAGRYVDCDGQMSREVSYVEWLGFLLSMTFYSDCTACPID